MAFVSLGILELVHSFNIRSDESVLKNGILKNKYLSLAVILGCMLQISIVMIPKLSKIFSVSMLNSKQWIITLIISVSPIFIIELQKKLNELKFGKIIREINIKTCQKTKDNV